VPYPAHADKLALRKIARRLVTPGKWLDRPAAARMSGTFRLMNRISPGDAALLFLRVASSILVLIVHGLPKAWHYTAQIAAIEDPFHLGKAVSLWFALFGEVVCPLLIILGIATRVAALPVLIITVIALLFVHPEWRIEQAQFAWMLLILFGTIVIGGAGRIRLDRVWRKAPG
jgi:putative oxidoreductase